MGRFDPGADLHGMVPAGAAHRLEQPDLRTQAQHVAGHQADVSPAAAQLPHRPARQARAAAVCQLRGQPRRAATHRARLPGGVRVEPQRGRRARLQPGHGPPDRGGFLGQQRDARPRGRDALGAGHGAPRARYSRRARDYIDYCVIGVFVLSLHPDYQ